MQNRNGFFSSADISHSKINFSRFIKAVKEGDGVMLDYILEAVKNGHKLKIDKKSDGKTALEIALDNNDLVSAAKLIKAGAETVFKSEVWVPDENSCYPYGGFETTYRSVFNDRKLYNSDFLTLAQLISHDTTAKNDCTETNRITF